MCVGVHLYVYIRCLLMLQEINTYTYVYIRIYIYLQSCKISIVMQARLPQVLHRRSCPAGHLNCLILHQWTVAVLDLSSTPPSLSLLVSAQNEPTLQAQGSSPLPRKESSPLPRKGQRSVPLRCLILTHIHSQNGLNPVFHSRIVTANNLMEAVRQLTAKLLVIPYHFIQRTPPPLHRVFSVGALKKWHLSPSLNLVSVYWRSVRGSVF